MPTASKGRSEGRREWLGPGLEVKPLGPRIGGGGSSLPKGQLEGFVEEVALSWALKLGAEHFSGKRREKGVLEVSFPPATKFYLSTN